MKQLFSLLFLLSTAAGASQLEEAFERLYNLDFAGAHRFVDTHIAANPSDPLGYSVRASALLFQEFDRMQILEGEFFADDKRLIDKKKIKPDPALKVRIFDCIAQAQKLAQARLAKNPKDADSLFAMSLASGLTGDYSSLIEKRQLNSFSYYKEANGFAQTLLNAHPTYVDAYMTTGFSEYLIGSLPFFAKWFVKIDGIEGSKDVAAQKMLKVVQSGRYLKPFAKILLSIFYLRENQPDRSKNLLAELARDYPENPLFKKELSRLAATHPK
jgi:predicted Zn-dependent protease